MLLLGPGLAEGYCGKMPVVAMPYVGLDMFVVEKEEECVRNKETEREQEFNDKNKGRWTNDPILQKGKNHTESRQNLPRQHSQ